MSRIRLATTGDAARIAEIYAPWVRDTAVSFELTPPDATEMARRIESTLVRDPWLVAERDGVVTGYAYASPHRTREAYQWAADVSVYIDAAAHREGIGRALYTALLAIIRAQGRVVAYGGITIPNDASIGLHEAMGFELLVVYRDIGYKLGGWHDVGWWELELAPRAPDPAPPLPLEMILDTPAWHTAIAAGEAQFKI